MKKTEVNNVKERIGFAYGRNWGPFSRVSKVLQGQTKFSILELLKKLHVLNWDFMNISELNQLNQITQWQGICYF